MTTQNAKNVRIDALIHAAQPLVQRWWVDYVYSQKRGYLRLLLNYEYDVEGAVELHDFDAVLGDMFWLATNEIRGENVEAGYVTCPLLPEEKEALRGMFRGVFAELTAEDRVHCEVALEKYMESCFGEKLDIHW